MAWSSQIAILNWSIEVFSKKDRPRLANSFRILASQVLYFQLTVFGQYSLSMRVYGLVEKKFVYHIKGPDKQTFMRKLVIFSLFIDLEHGFECSMEPSG